MRANGVDSANAGAIPELKPPAFQIIVLVCMEAVLYGGIHSWHYHDARWMRRDPSCTSPLVLS